MKGRYASTSMSIYGAILPGAARLARLPAEEPSETAKRRLKVIQWYQGHGGRVRLTARHFGFSPDTISRWARAYRKDGIAGLEPRSRRPRRVRQPQTPRALVERIQALREQYPRWGREKLRVLLEREGINISAKSIDRVIARLKARGVLREPLRPCKVTRWHQERLRRPPELVVDRPGLWCKWIPNRCLWVKERWHSSLGLWIALLGSEWWAWLLALPASKEQISCAGWLRSFLSQF